MDDWIRWVVGLAGRLALLLVCVWINHLSFSCSVLPKHARNVIYIRKGAGHNRHPHCSACWVGICNLQTARMRSCVCVYVCECVCSRGCEVRIDTRVRASWEDFGHGRIVDVCNMQICRIVLRHMDGLELATLVGPYYLGGSDIGRKFCALEVWPFSMVLSNVVRNVTTILKLWPMAD